MSSIDAVNAALSDGVQGEQDLGPLAWVLDELRKSLDGAVKALRRFVHDAELARGSDLAALDAAALRIARQQLHQACGALEMVGMESPALVLRAMEAAVQRFVQRPEMCTDDAAAALERASFALSEYLESVLAGKSVSAVTLFPQYRDVQALTGADRVHPADLWPAERRLREPQVDVSAAPMVYGSQARARLDQAVLRMVKEADFGAARDLRDVCLGFVAGQSEPQARSFWTIAAGFFEAFSLGLLAPDVYVKRVASRILMQYATLAKGDPDISDRLVQDLLFFCSQARPVAAGQAPALDAVRAAFALERFVPVDYEARRFGRFDPAVLAQARKRIAAATETWSALAGGDRNKLKPAADQFSLVCDSLRKLHGHSESLAQALTQAVGLSAQSGEPPSAALAMEVATAVLYLQAALEDLDTSDEQMTVRAQRLAERLDSVRGGAEPEPLEQWMEELYRRVSDHQTMGSVVDELRATLGEAERAMDQFFRNPQDAAPLAVVPGHMAQMRGVLSVLGLDQASLAVGRMRDTVERLLINEPSEEAQRGQTFEKLGNSLGALGFLIDMLSYQRALARKLFVYDEELGELRALMGRTRLRATDGSDAAAPLLEEHAPVSLPEVSARVPAPQAAQAPVDLDLSLPLEAPAESGADTGTLAEAEMPAAALQDGPQHATGVDAATLQEAAAVGVPAAVPDTEDDLQDVFLEEVREVVANGFAAIEALRQEPSELSEQTSLRRAFHTLKGSSRMVGLQEFGEAAWSLEQLLNAWLAEQKSMETPLLDLAARALQGFSQWADGIAACDAGAWQAAPFSHAADALRLGGTALPLVFPGDGSGAGDGLAAFSLELPEWDAAGGPATQFLADMPSSSLDFPEAVPDGVVGVGAFDEPAEGEMVPALEFPPLALPMEETRTAPEPPMLAATDQEIDFSAFSAALENPASASDADLPLDAAPWEGEENVAEQAAEQPAEGAELEALASHDAPQALTPALEWEPAPEGLAANDSSIAHAAQPAFLHVVGDDAERLAQEASDEAVKVIGSLRIGIPLYNVYLNEADEWSRRLVTSLQEWSLELDCPLPDVAVALAHSMAGSSATVGFTALSDTARLLEHALAHVQLQPQGLPEQAAVFMAAADEVRRLLHQFAAGFLKEPQPQILHDLRQILATEVAHTLSPPLEETPGALEAELAAWVDGLDDAESAPAEIKAAAPVVQAGHVAPALSIVPPAPSVEQERQVDDAIARAVSLGTDIDDDIDDDIDAIDLIDPDLFPIFEEEAAELLPHLGTALRQWAARPENQGARGEVLRALHTLKGSSRLAGAMRLGEMAHRLESAIEQLDADTVRAEQIEPLLGSFDALQASFDALRAISAQASADAEAAPVHGVQAVASDPPAQAPVAPRALARPQGPLALAPARAAAHQSVRVRAQLLDRLVNQAGEVMITRSRLEARLGQLKGSLADLSGNLDRLRQQLRDIEVQSESQMQSRLALSKDSAAGFDPLEFDRFTRVQELTRMMAESVNDVATVQRSLQRALEGTEDDLVAQGRQARELQRDLLRTRMVEFEGIAERLYAVVRQSSKEMGKQVKLDITGGSIEMDRGVLDRMTPAFEHLLRNCVAHGLESSEQRLAAGKSAVGAIAIDLRHEGNDVSVEFRDDGAGLNLARIREKALAQGLIGPGDAVGDAEAASLIFMPGFTTAAEVTGLAGRGIGMDVVHSEVSALGGRIETRTREGQGAAFRMVLPLTTAVTQVVMLRADHLTVGVPANVVEIVRRVAGPELDAAYRTGFFEVAGERLPFYWAGALLQASQRSSEPVGKTRPVVVFRSASQRIALHVDEVLGNQEVVVKNLGPQLSRLPGLAGMSVLASGAVVLIYNPVALSTVYGEQVRAAGSMVPDGAEAAALDGPAATAPALPAAGQVPLVLVVDDSITVRRVTQRLLQREGYRVALAADGLQALERLQAERPAVVLSDIEMPRMDGFDLARNIRADEAMRELPIIMITSRIAQKHREHALELGVNHYLGKPYSDEELLSLVQHYARLATAQAEA